MTPEQKQRLKEVEENRRIWHGNMGQVTKDINFLLSLVKSQAAGAGIPQWRKGWPEVNGFYWSRETPDDMNILLVEIHRNRLTICGGNKLNVKEAFEGDDDEFLGPITPTATADAAISMRSACVEKLRTSIRDPSLRFSDEGVKAAITDWTNILISRLESLSIEQPSSSQQQIKK